MPRIPRYGRPEALRFFCSGQPPYSECLAFLVVGGPKRCALWPPREDGSIRASMQASCRPDPSSRGADLIQKEPSIPVTGRRLLYCTYRHLRCTTLDCVLPSQTAGKKSTFPCLLCSRRASGNGENRRLLFRGGPFRFTDRTGPRFWPQFRSDVQIRARIPVPILSCMFRTACGTRFFPALWNRPSDPTVSINIFDRGYAGAAAGFFRLVLPFTDDTNLCKYICYRGHLSRGGGQICVLRAGSAGQHPSRHV